MKVVDWQKALGDWSNCTVEVGEFLVEFDYIDEGNSGDYNDDDPDDVPRLRFYCYRYEPIEEDYWELGYSYCTMLTPLVSKAVLHRYADMIADALDSGSPKRRIEEITWITEEDIEANIKGDSDEKVS